MIETRIRRFSECHGIRESNEIYVVSLANNDTNIKIRDDDLELKSLIKKQDNLEQWYPRTNRVFPLTAATLEEELFRPCKVAMPSLSLESYSLHQFLNEIVLPHEELSAAAVFKRRFAFTVNDCMTELVEVWTMAQACIPSRLNRPIRQRFTKRSPCLASMTWRTSTIFVPSSE